jgi:hypothetical protein
MFMSDNELENIFTYHPPATGQPEKYEMLRNAAKEFAYLIKDKVPSSPERREALNRLREVIMWANAGIACNEID